MGAKSHVGAALRRGPYGKQRTTVSSQQGTEAPDPTALEEVNPASNHVGELRFLPLPGGAFGWDLSPGQRTQLRHTRIPDPQERNKGLLF